MTTKLRLHTENDNDVLIPDASRVLFFRDNETKRTKMFSLDQINEADIIDSDYGIVLEADLDTIYSMIP